MNPLLSRKAETRKRIVDTAARLFLDKGVDRVGVDEIMRECGLTHGGFYGYFPSKEALVAEACTAALHEAARDWQELARKLGDDAAWTEFARSYLAEDLSPANKPACPAAVLGADVARRPEMLQASYVALIRSLIGNIAEDAGADRGYAILSLVALVGATSLATQVSQDPALAAEILDTTRDELLKCRPVRAKAKRSA